MYKAPADKCSNSVWYAGENIFHFKSRDVRKKAQRGIPTLKMPGTTYSQIVHYKIITSQVSQSQDTSVLYNFNVNDKYYENTMQ